MVMGDILFEIKNVPEDFYVREISNIKVKKTGEYTYFLLKKINYNTETAIQKIARIIKKPRKLFGFAGSKDKIAVTEQVCSFRGKIKSFKIEDIEVDVLGYGDIPVSLGDLKDNFFRIVVTNAERRPHLSQVINYFDDQRFGRNNKQVGELIIKKEFEKAAKIIQETEKCGNISNNDYIGFLRKIPKKILQMYVHAYQSYLWNSVVDEYIKKRYKYREIKYCLGGLAIPLQKVPNKNIPIVGFGTEFEDKDIKKIYENLMKKEKIILRDFIVRSMPELTNEGSLRDLTVEPKDFTISENNKKEKSYVVEFILQKGSYATMVIKTLFS